MDYSLLAEYQSSILSAETALSQLHDLFPVLDEAGTPVQRVGKTTVLFQVQDQQGRLYALKCFMQGLEECDRRYRQITEALKPVFSPYLVPVRYFPEEMTVCHADGSTEKLPVVLMEWVCGKTLDEYVQEHLSEKNLLHQLSERFCQLAAWLVVQPFAHGDLEPKNILVKEDGSLVLVDYDNLYAPSMQGEMAWELGNPDFRHPFSSPEVFDRHIDDFPLASISLSLKAIALNPMLYETYGAPGRLLFTAADYRDLSRSEVMKALQPYLSDPVFEGLYAAWMVVHAKGSFPDASSQVFDMQVEEPMDDSEDEMDQAIWIDTEGVAYSEDGTVLLKGSGTLERYVVREGTRTIASNAFFCCKALQRIRLPESLEQIGDSAFEGCESLELVVLPDAVTTLGASAFEGCHALASLKLPDALTAMGDRAFADCRSLEQLTLPESLATLGANPFCCCPNLTVKSASPCFVVKDNLLYTEAMDRLIASCSKKGKVSVYAKTVVIGESAFEGSIALTEAVLPDSVQTIEAKAFRNCALLKNVFLPHNLTGIAACAFEGCSSLQELVLPSGVRFLGERALSGCESLAKLALSDALERLDKFALLHCKQLFQVMLPPALSAIGENPFVGCTNLTLISRSARFLVTDGILYQLDPVKVIASCSRERKVVLLDSVTGIADCAFQGCTEMEEVVLPDSITSIGSQAFWGCEALKEIRIPAGKRAYFAQLIDEEEWIGKLVEA